jgi:hypothetical protein
MFYIILRLFIGIQVALMFMKSLANEILMIDSHQEESSNPFIVML